MIKLLVILFIIWLLLLFLLLLLLTLFTIEKDSLYYTKKWLINFDSLITIAGPVQYIKVPSSLLFLSVHQSTVFLGNNSLALSDFLHECEILKQVSIDVAQFSRKLLTSPKKNKEGPK